ncbi:MAG TPA: hypothetical protein VFG03_05840, partial [Telluria sp.]|nr:hypothetical protein [Telluria sp.]
MRIVIDLQHYQAGRAPRALDAALALARADTGNELWIAVCVRYPAGIDALRVAFDAVLPSERVVSYDLPSAARPWSERATAAIRANFLSTLAPDLVLTPAEADSVDTLRGRIAAGAKMGSEFFFAGSIGENYSDPNFAPAAIRPRL